MTTHVMRQYSIGHEGSEDSNHYNVVSTFEKMKAMQQQLYLDMQLLGTI